MEPTDVRPGEVKAGSNGHRIGVYVCHCGTNISGKVDVVEAAAYAATLPGVVVAREYKFICSDPGQELIIKDIKELNLDRVVVASCSPRMHEPTFRSACGRAGLNPFLMAMANIREHCSWVTVDPEAATDKAKALIHGAVLRTPFMEPLERREVPVHPATLIIGGGIAGIQAALEVAGANRPVYLVEKDASIGGHMARFDKTFPTLDCFACILTPKMVSVAQNPNIELLTYSEVDELSGFVGNFKAKVRRKARPVDEEACNGCGACWEVCPTALVPRKRQMVLGGQPIKGTGAPPPDLPVIVGAAATLEKLRKTAAKLAESDKTKPGECNYCQVCVRVCRDVVGAAVLDLDKPSSDRSTWSIVASAPERCIACGACATLCPTGHLRLVALESLVAPFAQEPRETGALPAASEIRHDELLLGPNKAIGIPFMQAVPAVPVIDRATCIHYRTGGCGACAEVCDKNAIDFAAEDKVQEIEVGSVIVATGFQPFDPTPLAQYGYGRLKNVVTALEFELLNNASGPTNGKILRADGQPPESVALIHCVGSRDRCSHEYCSRVCCMAALKYAHLIHEKTGATVYDFYIDLRCFGKGYEEFYNRLLEEGVFFVRARAAEVSDFAVYEEERGKLVVRAEDTLIGVVRRIPVDMVVLMAGLEPTADAERIARTVNVSRGRDGFFLEQHPKLAPVATPTDGVFIAGCCQGPKDIPDTVAQASAAAAAALSLSVRGKVLIEPIICRVNGELCSGCRICNTLCPYSAISYDEAEKVSVINDALCKGCGTCAAACPGGAIWANHFTDQQVLSEIRGVCT
jgi:heterodisulfide reductase subunit A-like polyferredoxin